jgi:DHA1 family inner membrane transport protein
LPLVVPLLALGAFLMCTTEFLIAGLLPQMAADFGVRPSQIGLLITAFAVGMIVGAPVMALATLRLPKRATLVLALATFAAAHAIAALSGSFALLFVARVLTGVVTGAFWSAASVVATRAVGPDARTHALGVIGSGVALATVLGVPVGSLAGEQLGWRGAFWGLAALAVIAAAVIGRFTRGDRTPPAVSVHSEFRALRDARLWLVLGGTVLVMGGCMGTFSFISPLLTERSGISLELVPLVFVCFGVGSMLGTNVRRSLRRPPTGRDVHRLRARGRSRPRAADPALGQPGDGGHRDHASRRGDHGHPTRRHRPVGRARRLGADARRRVDRLGLQRRHRCRLLDRRADARHVAR